MVRSGRVGARSRRFIGIKGQALFESISQNDLPAISVDARLIQQALSALLSNAAAHGGSNKPIEVSAARDGSMLVISVADRGPGLAPGEENKVFEKFYRGPRTRPVASALGFPLPGNWWKRTAVSSWRKIAKAAARDFPFAFPLANRCDCQPKRPRNETGRADHRR